MDDNIHAPTVPSGPTSVGASGGRDISKMNMTELLKEKELLEAELKALGDVLQSHGVNMSTTLTTFDGYPRDDIDIAQIRTTRARIIYLRNDYKAVMGKIEQEVHSYFANMPQDQAGAPVAPTQVGAAAVTNEGEEGPSSQNGLVETPFAKVNSVAAGSPAAQAGLKDGDRIRNFGGVNWMNHENLRKISDVVQNSQGRPLSVKIARPDESGQGLTNLSLQLTPRPNWGGRGLLGCHVLLL